MATNMMTIRAAFMTKDFAGSDGSSADIRGASRIRDSGAATLQPGWQAQVVPLGAAYLAMLAKKAGGSERAAVASSDALLMTAATVVGPAVLAELVLLVEASSGWGRVRG
jgi:hypothetical protein